MSDLYTCIFSPVRTVSPHLRSAEDVESQYLAELLAEHQKLGPFMQILPICSHLLNKEILRVSDMISTQGFGDGNWMQQKSPSPMGTPNFISNAVATGFGGQSATPQETLGFPQGVAIDRLGAPTSPTSCTVKKVLRLEIPVDTYPDCNFVGRLLGPRGNSLKRVEASMGCRVFIRGKGSIRDSNQEDKMRGRPGYEHLNDSLHILIEAELPANVIDARLKHAQQVIQELLKPVDEPQDHYKRQQLQELVMLNSGIREEHPHPSGSISLFNNGMEGAC